LRLQTEGWQVATDPTVWPAGENVAELAKDNVSNTRLVVGCLELAAARKAMAAP
jgi:hypothetical protein